MGRQSDLKHTFCLPIFFLFCSQSIYEETTMSVVSSVLGVLTHYYFLSYYNYSKQESIHTKKQCPECKHNIFDEDHQKMEVCCRTCGLVLVAPPNHSFEPAGYKYPPQRMKLRVHSKVREKWWVVSYHL